MVLERGRDFWLNSELQRSQLVDDDEDYLGVLQVLSVSLENFAMFVFWLVFGEYSRLLLRIRNA